MRRSPAWPLEMVTVLSASTPVQMGTKTCKEARRTARTLRSERVFGLFAFCFFITVPHRPEGKPARCCRNFLLGESQRDSIIQPRVASLRATLGKWHPVNLSTQNGLHHRLSTTHLWAGPIHEARKWSADGLVRANAVQTEHVDEASNVTRISRASFPEGWLTINRFTKPVSLPYSYEQMTWKSFCLPESVEWAAGSETP